MERITLAKRIEKELRRRISAGVYPPGSYLPSERQLSREFETTRTTLGVALGVLAGDRLVLRSPGRGTRVLSPADRLEKPLIGLIHGATTAAGETWSQDSLATLHGAQDALKRLRYQFELAAIQPGKNPVFEDWRRFGAVVCIDQASGLFDELTERRIPFVVAKLELEADVCCTYVNHIIPSLESVRNLVRLGHRRIAFVGREPGYGFYARAREGYEAGLREANLPPDEKLIGVCEKTDALSGYFAAKPLLELSDRPTAIVAARDTLAEGVCRAIEEKHLRVGYHVSVIGFDHMTWPDGEEVLTTFHEPCYEMGSAAAEMLAAWIVNRSLPKEKRQFDTPFILRRSAGPPPNESASPQAGALRRHPKAANVPPTAASCGLPTP